MTVEAIRVQNFMGFADSRWIELRPLTLLFGSNSSGKSAFVRALLLLQQSLQTDTDTSPLLFVKDRGFDFGDYYELIRGHQTRRDMSFWFRCRLSTETEEQKRSWEALHRMGAEGDAVRLRLTYGRQTGTSSIALQSVDLYDESGDVLLQATAQDRNRNPELPWRFDSAFFDPRDEPEPNLWPYLRMAAISGFLPMVLVTDSSLDLIQEDAPDNVSAFGETFNRLWWILRGIRSSIAGFLQTLNYLGPLRAEPQRFYYVSGHTRGLAMQGQHTVRNILEAQALPGLLDRINDWLADSCFGLHMDLRPLDRKKTLYELRLADATSDSKRRMRVNIREVGFGLSQVLPIIVQTMLSPENATLIIEQPELHLHPRAQADLGDLFVRVARQSGVRLLLETHSEHILLRLRRRIAETSAGTAPAEARLDSESLSAYFVDRLGGQSSAQAIEIDRLGQYEYTPAGFRDFFADDALEILAISKAARQLALTKHS